MITKARIRRHLRELGIGPGAMLLVHSSLSSLGWVEGGADAVVDALLTVVGPRGAVMFPTFSFLNFEPVFDPQTTPSEVGAITEAARRHQEARRSLHPRHSVVVIGTKAEELTSGHLEAGALGRGSPPDQLARKGGRVLLLGVGHEANSIIHVAEAYAEVPYLGAPRSPGFPQKAAVRMPGGEELKVSLMPIPTCSRGFGKLEPLLRAKGLIRDGRVGRAHCQLMRAQDVIDVAVEVLRHNPRFLLCHVPGCWACARKREMIEAAETARRS